MLISRLFLTLDMIELLTIKTMVDQTCFN